MADEKKEAEHRKRKLLDFHELVNERIQLADRLYVLVDTQSKLKRAIFSSHEATLSNIQSIRSRGFSNDALKDEIENHYEKCINTAAEDISSIQLPLDSFVNAGLQILTVPESPTDDEADDA